MTINRHSARKPQGQFTVTGPDIKGGVLEIDTLACVHCGGHWQVNPGSGKIRGYCARCNGPVCGPQCAECIPKERVLEMLEGTITGREVSVPVLWTP